MNDRSYGDASLESLQSDVHRIFLGYLIMFAYTVVMLGRQGGLGSRRQAGRVSQCDPPYPILAGNSAPG